MGARPNRTLIETVRMTLLQLIQMGARPNRTLIESVRMTLLQLI